MDALSYNSSLWSVTQIEETEELPPANRDRLEELNKVLTNYILEFMAKKTRKISLEDSNLIFEDVHVGNKDGFYNFIETAKVEVDKKYKILSLYNIETSEKLDNVERLIIPLPDSNAWETLKKNLDRFFQFINKARIGKATLLVHCESGISRSGAVMVAYLMWSTGLPYDKVLEFVRNKRTFTNPEDDLRKGILDHFKE